MSCTLPGHVQSRLGAYKRLARDPVPVCLCNPSKTLVVWCRAIDVEGSMENV